MNAEHNGSQSGLVTLSHGFFAVTLIGLGILGLIQGDFVPTWSGIGPTFPGRVSLAYVTSAITLACGIGLWWRRTALNASRLLLVSFAIWMVAIRFRVIIKYPTVTGAWWAAGDTAVMMAVCLVLYVWFAGDWDKRRLAFVTGANGLRIATILYGLAMIPFGIAHFAYLDRTTPLVPSWLPFHLFWAYFTGSAFIAAGLAMLFNVVPRLAAALSTWQMGGFTLLVWVPIMLGHPSASDKQEFISSWALTAAAWVVTDAYRGRKWFGVGKG